MSDKEFALSTYWDDCLKAAKVNLFSGELVFIKTIADEDEYGITEVPVLRGYTKRITEHGFIHPADIAAYLYHSDIDRIRKRALENKMKSTHTFRRKIGDVFKWITYEITTPKSFSEENPWALLTWREADSEMHVMEDAMVMLSSIFHKILKIDLTDESHEEIKVYEQELSESSGYAPKISDWFRAFAECGNVHEKDLVEYLSFTDINSLRAKFAASSECIRCRYRRNTPDGFRWVCMEILPSMEYTPENQIVMLYVRDIHDEYISQLERQKELEHYCSTDVLTNLGNRYRYNSMCAEFEKHPEYSPVGVVFADVNGLKYTNDRFGHEKGDELINGFAQRLSDFFGRENCCRISGDEFIVLIKNADKDEFMIKVEAFREQLNADNAEPPAAIGWAWTAHAAEVKKAARTAEANMYADKQAYYVKYPHLKR